MNHRLLLCVCLFAWHADIARCEQQLPEAAKLTAADSSLPKLSDLAELTANEFQLILLEIANTELNLESARSQYGPKHPSVLRMEQWLERLNAKLLGARYAMTARLARDAGPVTRNPSQQAASTLPSPVDRATIELARETAEKQHQAAEEASHQAAAEYRAEAAQESPDAKALTDLKQKLETSVKAAFAAQRKLQQVRLQLAELDLAEVKAKHLRRKSLAAKIIERRVADLMSGENLDWQTKTQGQPRDSGTRLTRANGEAEADHGSVGKPPRRVGLNDV